MQKQIFFGKLTGGIIQVTPQLYIWLSMLVFLLGIIALVLEIFILPGFGVAGITGIILIAWGILLLAVDFTQATQALLLALVATVAVFFFGLRFFKRFNLWQRLTLGTKQYKEAGYTAPQSDLIMHTGKTGKAVTPLRPSGIAEVFGQRLDVVTEGEFIPAGTEVEVVRVEGARIVVRAIGSPR
jgi:membrane-bound serine protease (ClpP class)